MHTFVATVLLSGLFIQTQVQALTAHHADLLFKQQYGKNSVVIFPRQVE